MVESKYIIKGIVESTVIVTFILLLLTTLGATPTLSNFYLLKSHGDKKQRIVKLGLSRSCYGVDCKRPLYYPLSLEFQLPGLSTIQSRLKAVYTLCVLTLIGYAITFILILGNCVTKMVHRAIAAALITSGVMIIVIFINFATVLGATLVSLSAIKHSGGKKGELGITTLSIMWTTFVLYSVSTITWGIVSYIRAVNLVPKCNTSDVTDANSVFTAEEITFYDDYDRNSGERNK